jgi:hypothetical protein
LIFHAFSYMAKFTVNTCLVIFDWKEYFKPLNVPKFNNIIYYRSFCFVKEEANIVLYFKKSTLSPEWLGENRSPDTG